MAKKNMDILLGNILGKAAIHPQDRFDKSPVNPQEQQISAPSPQTESDSPNDEPWRHFSFICSKELVDKVQSIARKEGFTIRSFMEYVMKQGVKLMSRNMVRSRKSGLKPSGKSCRMCGRVAMYT